MDNAYDQQKAMTNTDFVADHNANSYMYIVSQCEAVILVNFSEEGYP